MKLKLFITLALLCNMLFANAVPDVVNRKYDLRAEVAVNQITCSASSTSLCQGTSVAVTFIASGTYNSGNVFTAQLSNASGSFVSPVNIGTKNAVASGTILAIIPSNAIAGTGYRIRVVASNLATIGLDNGTNITVNQAPIASISATSTICSGSTGIVTFMATPNATVTYAINGGPNRTIVLDDSGNATLMTSPLSVSSFYSLVSVASSGSVCSKLLSGSAMINVMPLPVVAISTTTPTVCSGSTGTVIFTGTPNATVTYNVDGGPSQMIALNASGTATLTTPTLTQNRTYGLLSVISELTNCIKYVSQNLTITVYSAPTGNSFQGPCVSDPSNATLASFNLVGTNIKWYLTAIGGSVLPLTTVLQNNQTYWASQTSSNMGCESSRFPVVASVIVTPVPTGNPLQMFCNDPLNPPTINNLVATGNNNWYTAATGGFPLASTTPLIDGQSYFATTVSLPCESQTRFKVTAMVTNNAVTLSGNQGICVGLTTVFSSTVAGGTWISSSPAVATINSSGVVTGISVGTATMSYTVTGTGVCPNYVTTRTVSVNPIIIPVFTPIAPICSSSVLAPLPTISTNGISGTWSPALNNTTTTIYTFTPNSGQCATSRASKIVVNPKITPTFSAIAPICSGSILAPLPTTSANGITGAWSPALNNTATTIYTFTPNAGQCATTTSLTITINPVPIVTAIPSLQTMCSGSMTFIALTSSRPGTTFSWNVIQINAVGASPGSGNSIMQTLTAGEAGEVVYGVTPSANGCDGKQIQVSVIVNPIPTPIITTVNDRHDIYIDNTTVVQPLLLDIQLPSGNDTFQWYEDGVLIDGATSATYLVNTFSTNGTRNYTVDANRFTCKGTAAAFTVNQSPVPAPSGNRLQYFTSGQTLANLVVAGSTIVWHSAPTNRSAASSVLPMNTILVNGMTYYASQTINGYESPTRLEVKVQTALSNNQFKFKDLKYSPNPIVDVLHIQSEDVIKKVSVCNTLGQEVYRQECNTLELNLELAYLVSGNYFIKVESDSKQQVFKVIKK